MSSQNRQFAGSSATPQYASEQKSVHRPTAYQAGRQGVAGDSVRPAAEQQVTNNANDTGYVTRQYIVPPTQNPMQVQTPILLPPATPQQQPQQLAQTPEQLSGQRPVQPSQSFMKAQQQLQAEVHQTRQKIQAEIQKARQQIQANTQQAQAANQAQAAVPRPQQQSQAPPQPQSPQQTPPQPQARPLQQGQHAAQRPQQAQQAQPGQAPPQPQQPQQPQQPPVQQASPQPQAGAPQAQQKLAQQLPAQAEAPLQSLSETSAQQQQPQQQQPPQAQQNSTVTPAAHLHLQAHQQNLQVQQQVNQAAAQPLPQGNQQHPQHQQQRALHPGQAQAQLPPHQSQNSTQLLAAQSYTPHFLQSVQNLPQHQQAGGQIQHIPQPQLQLAATAYSKYKLPVIPGVAPRTTLPPGVGLVLEGGGMRGFYSAGVFEAFMDAGIMFPYIAAVSAGAANVLSYVSGQRGRNRLIVERLVGDPRYLSGSNLIKDRSLFNFDFIFKTVPEKYLYWDEQMFERTQTRLLTGAIDCREGKTIWFEKSALAPDFTPTIASCSIPLLSRMVRFDNRELLDGGILDPIPIEKSVADGNRFHVIVLTQNAGYIKPATKIGAMLRVAYRKYPHLMWAIKERHEAYNRQVALAEKLEREGRALIIRPHSTVEVTRVESDPNKLLDLHDEGHLDGALAVDKLHQIFKF